MTSHSRYAIYYTAPGLPLAELGAAWLGWDIATATALEQSLVQAAYTSQPRRYGFHATLKAPFRLTSASSFDEMREAAATLAKRRTAFEIGPLAVTGLGGFLALTTTQNPALNALATACVTELDGLRAPSSETELNRRRARGLTPAQEANLIQWGYPHVLGEFQFHMTLTGRLSTDDRAKAMREASRHFGTVIERSHLCSTISLCGERPDGHFEELEVFRLEG